MTSRTRHIAAAWLTLARYGPPLLRRVAIGRALALSREPAHSERIRAARAATGIDAVAALDTALAWLAIESKVSAHDFGPGGGLIHTSPGATYAPTRHT